VHVRTGRNAALQRVRASSKTKGRNSGEQPWMGLYDMAQCLVERVEKNLSN